MVLLFFLNLLEVWPDTFSWRLALDFAKANAPLGELMCTKVGVVSFFIFLSSMTLYSNVSFCSSFSLTSLCFSESSWLGSFPFCLLLVLLHFHDHSFTFFKCLSSPLFLFPSLHTVGFLEFVVRFSPDSNELQGEN